MDKKKMFSRRSRIAWKALEDGNFCTAVFLDISQAFDKVWHPGLLHMLKHFLPYTYLAQTPEIGKGLGRFLSCGARKPEQT